MDCPLCRSNAFPCFAGHHGEYFSCPTCNGIFLSPENRLDETAEKARYIEHNNDVNDPRYQRFVSPIVDHIRVNFTPAHNGLDFGCGTGPVVSFMLGQEGLSVKKFDPFFSPDRSVLSAMYDFIICCEVIEHFHEPAKEFQLLRSLLLDDAHLICMTHLLTDETDLKNWYYKDDPTHVFFYREETIEFIRSQFRFRRFDIRERMVVFMT